MPSGKSPYASGASSPLAACCSAQPVGNAAHGFHFSAACSSRHVQALREAGTVHTPSCRCATSPPRHHSPLPRSLHRCFAAPSAALSPTTTNRAERAMSHLNLGGARRASHVAIAARTENTPQTQTRRLPARTVGAPMVVGRRVVEQKVDFKRLQNSVHKASTPVQHARSARARTARARARTALARTARTARARAPRARAPRSRADAHADARATAPRDIRRGATPPEAPGGSQARVVARRLMLSGRPRRPRRPPFPRDPNERAISSVRFWPFWPFWRTKCSARGAPHSAAYHRCLAMRRVMPCRAVPC